MRFAFRMLPLVLSLLAAGMSAASPGTGLLYGTTRANDLITINPVTGAPTLVGNMGSGPMPALAVSPASGVIYSGAGAGSPLVFTLSPATGVATLLGNSGLGFSAISSFDFGPGGILYASVNIVNDGGSGGDNLATINLATGVATVIGSYGLCGPAGCALEGMEAIAFDLAGTLYGATANGTNPPALYTINTATGQATFVAPILMVTGAPPGGGISALAFSCDGTLYAGTARTQGGANGGVFGTLHKVTGVFAPIGQTIADRSSLLDLSFQAGCGVVKSRPSTWGRVKSIYR